LLAVVALLTSPFWLLMLLNANRGRSRTQALSGVMVDLAQHFGMVPNREGSDVSFAGEIEDVPIEFVATNLETSPKLRIRVPLPTSLKVVSFRPREGSKGIGSFDSGDKNFDAAVATDGEVPWLGNLLDSDIRAGLGALVLSLSGRVENGQLTAEIPITLQELPDDVELPAIPTPPTATPPAPEAGGVMVQVGPPPKPPPPGGTLGYLVTCTEKVISLAKMLIAQSAIRVERLTTVGREESAQGVRLAALKGLMLLQRPEKVAGFVQDNDPVVRLFACSQVGDFGVAHAEAMLEDIPGPTLPADARFPPDRTAESLKAWRPLKDSSLIRGLLHRFCRSAEVSIRHAAIGAAVRLQLPDVLAFLRSIPDLPEDRLVLVQAVLHNGDSGGERLLWKWLAFGDETVRQKAVEALVALGSARSVEMLQALTQGRLPEEKADGSFHFADPKPNKEGKMERIPVSPALSRAACDAAATLQQRLEGKESSPKESDSVDRDGAGSDLPTSERERAERPAEAIAERSESEGRSDTPGRSEGEGRPRPVIPPSDGPPSPEEQAKIDARKARIEARRQESDSRRQEASASPELAARIAEAQARAAAMRQKS
jgi:hypothetical protein